jgi:hypothetical protein
MFVLSSSKVRLGVNKIETRASVCHKSVMKLLLFGRRQKTKYIKGHKRVTVVEDITIEA